MAVKLTERENGGWATSQVTVRVVRGKETPEPNNAASDTKEYLKNRAARGSRQKLLDVLAKSPDVEPDEADRIAD